jgi:oligoribonuclease (3'-5' exoribonuclease)
MSENFYIWNDLETGGLKPKTADILTGYFAVFDENGKFVEDLALKLKPDDRLPMADAGALKVNKIDLKAHLEDPETITYSEARKKLLALIKKYLKKNGRYSNIILAGYNVRFDLRFINEYLISEDDWEELVHYKVHDVMDGVDFLKRNGWLPSDIGKLTKCAEYFEVAQGIAHTAKDDIFMTIAVDGKIKELMDSKKNGGQQVDLISQLEAE